MTAGALTTIVCLGAFAGCSGPTAQASSNSANSANSGNSTTSANAAAAATSVEPIVLYAAEGYDSTVAKAFTAKTGIPVKVDDDSTGPLTAKITAEKDNPQWTLFWADGDTGFASLDQQGLLAPYQSASATFTDAGQKLQPASHGYTVSATTVMAALIYNAAAVTSVPTAYTDLETAPYTGKVGMNDPSQSGPTYPFIAGLMNQFGGQSNGVAAGEAFLTKLKANGLHVYPTNGDTLHALESGQIDYGMIQSSAALGEVLKTKATAKYKPEIAYLPLSTLLPSCIAIDKGADAQTQKEAQQFIDYVLSPEGQAVMQTGDPSGDSLFWPVVTGVSALPALPAMPTQYQVLDPTFWGPLEGQVNSWFDSTIK